jgi:hypothetical protein
MLHRPFSAVTALIIGTIACRATAQLHVALIDPTDVMSSGFLSDAVPTGDDTSNSAAARVDPSRHSNCAGSHCGCHGRDVCCPRMEEVTEQKSCWTVKCENVCVPAVRFPWEPGGPRLTLFSWRRERGQSAKFGDTCGRCNSCCHNGDDCAHCPTKCGSVRCVSVLEKEEFEVTSTRCKWEMLRLPPCTSPDCLTPAAARAASALDRHP